MATIKTRLTKTSPKVETQIDIDWIDVTDEQLKAFAARSVIIDQQALYRAAGSIPSNDIIVVADLLNKQRTPRKVTPDAALAQFSKLSDDEKAEYMAKLFAMQGMEIAEENDVE